MNSTENISTYYIGQLISFIRDGISNDYSIEIAVYPDEIIDMYFKGKVTVNFTGLCNQSG